MFWLRKISHCTSRRGDRPHASSQLLNRLKAAKLTWSGIPQVQFGTMLSGEKLIDNEDFREELVSHVREAIGGEMEGAGLYAACQDKKTDWILVKGICDWADGDKSTDKENRQRSAAKNAAEFVLYALKFVQSSSGASDKASSSSYCSLPVQPFFFGREQELKDIADAIKSDARTWGALIDGAGGIGKTSLAVRAAHDAPCSDFSHKIFLSAKSRELTAGGVQEIEDFVLRDITALLTELARELGDSEVSKLPEAERAQAVKRILTRCQALIVIDNVESFPDRERARLNQFLDVLPQGCKAIVTSRRRSDVAARIIRLERMPKEDALALIDELAKTNRYLSLASAEDRIKLYAVTGGNPLFLRWTSAQLGRAGSHCRTVEDACDFLKNAPPQNDPMEYIFGDLIGTLGDDEIACLAALTHFDVPAKVSWIASSADLSVTHALTALDDLTYRGLVTSDAGWEAYYLASLAAIFLQRRCAGAIAETGQRLSDRVCELSVDNGYTQFNEFPVLEDAWPMLAAGLSRLVLSEDARLQKVCDALWRFFDFSGRWGVSISLNQQGERIALKTGDCPTAFKRAWRNGWTYAILEQATETMACADRAESYRQLCNADPEKEADVERLRGLAYIQMGKHEAASDALKVALSLYRREPVNENVASILSGLGNVERSLGNCESAERYYRQALEIAHELNSSEGIASYSGTLAAVAIQGKRWAEAERISLDTLSTRKIWADRNLLHTTVQRWPKLFACRIVPSVFRTRNVRLKCSIVCDSPAG